MGPEIEAPLCRNIQTYRSKSLRELACFLRHTDGFISCDTGPLHWPMPQAQAVLVCTRTRILRFMACWANAVSM